MKYRSRTDIITAILNSANGGATKTRIMYGAYLSYAQAKEYLGFLISKGLLAEQDGIFSPTTKGIELLRAVEGVSDLLSLSKPAQALQAVQAEKPEQRSHFSFF